MWYDFPLAFIFGILLGVVVGFYAAYFYLGHKKPLGAKDGGPGS